MQISLSERAERYFPDSDLTGNQTDPRQPQPQIKQPDCLTKSIVSCGVIDNNGELDPQSANVEVNGNLLYHDQLHLIVNTSSSKHNISLTRVQDEVMPDNVQSFLVYDNRKGKTEIHTSRLTSDVLKYKGQFFHNLDTGSIVSIIPSNTRQIHVEGFLYHGIIIAPPGAADRHKRDLHISKHTVWRDDDSERHVDYLEVPPEFANENLVEKTRRHIVHKRFSGRAGWRNNGRRFSERDNDRSHRHEKEDKDEKEEREDKQTDEPLDYLEVPAYFRDTHSFKARAAHQIVKRQVKDRPFVIEVFLLVDFKVFEWFKKDIAKLGTYLLHFWQAVNFKFRTMKDPNVSVKVKQYGAVRSAKFQSFIEENRMKNDTSLISLKEVLGGFREWMIKFESNLRFSSHDVAVLMTG
ncbi:hypothetical protein LOTGIDRAFT_235070 [Lottia gigantea]|uniref:Uncharacterized protein n=1 Tax=Lottia gigantea TaxID=225164 RepID=V3Z9L7_LOTGI|nr:hypothetical protein LOTGIDRAFT_235070 [Lottia gigantea]ESO87623.1 hypothetical protein LOTGIDRAFT_235070 [Lottia gigantea]